MDVVIRPETTADHPAVYALVAAAFRELAVSNHDEQDLVVRLRQSDAFVPELSLVAVVDDTVVGHVLLTKLPVVEGDTVHTLLALAPLAVAPAWQKRGIGGHLLAAAHQAAKALGYPGIVLVGHPAYYPRFGYRPAASFELELPFAVPAEAFMALELTPGSLTAVRGMVTYPSAFFAAEA